LNIIEILYPLFKRLLYLIFGTHNMNYSLHLAGFTVKAVHEILIEG